MGHLKFHQVWDILCAPGPLNEDESAAIRKALGGRGVGFQGEILVTGVCHMAFFADPDGNALMLHHRYAPRATDL